MSDPFNSGTLLSDLTPELVRIRGYTEDDRHLELIRLGCEAPPHCAGYVTQIANGTRRVRLDAMRQLQRAGIRFTVDARVIAE